MTATAAPTIRVDPSTIEIRIVRTPDEFAMAAAIRAAVFLAEEDNITYFDEFNGNDYAGTHLLAFVNGDPAGVIRVRWFADFALLERVGIRKRYRSYQVFLALARAAIELARQKGYRMVTGRPRIETIKLWKRLWANPSGPAIKMYRGTLLPMVIDVPDRPEAGRISATQLGETDFENMIAQVEGTWNFGRAVPQPFQISAAE